MKLEFSANSDNTIPRVVVLYAILLGAAWYDLSRDAGVRIHGIPAHVCGWGMVVLAAVISPYMILSPYWRRGPHLIIDEEGIEDRAGGFGRIAWEDVTAMSVRHPIGGRGRADFLCLQLVDPEKYLCRLPVRQRVLAGGQAAVGYPETVINFAAYRPGLPESVDQIREILLRRASAGRPVPQWPA